jgi:hypothetical protein
MDTGHEALVSCCFLRTIAAIFIRFGLNIRNIPHRQPGI